MPKTLIVVNPNAANGHAGERWKRIEPILREQFGDLMIAITQSPDDVTHHIYQAYEAGLTRVISIGGDGTNHSVINGLAGYRGTHPDAPQVEYGMLPVGTGQDWARSRGIPFDDYAAVQWIASASAKPVDVGHVQLGDESIYFLNIASVGISGDVVTRVEESNRRPWSFLAATVRSLFGFQPPVIQVRLDGDDWYEGASYLVAIANGTTFGRGMKVAPQADISDGLFDVILVEGISRLRALDAIRRVYTGTHLNVEQVHHCRASTVAIQGLSDPLGMELDGEFAQGQTLHFTIKQGLLNLLV